MSARVDRIVIVGRDAPLWLSAAVLKRALAPSGISVTAVALPEHATASDVYATQPPLEALHNQLGIREGALLRAVEGAYTLGQNFVDTEGGTVPFMHPYGGFGPAIDGQDFFAFWLKARQYGLPVSLEDFSLTAAAARQGRLMIPDDETERYCRCDYGYHLPALAYGRFLKAVALKAGVAVQESTAVEVALDPGTGVIKSLLLDDDRRVEGDIFVDVSGADALLMKAMGVAWESWRDHFPADRMLTARGPRFRATPVYAENRAWGGGWAMLQPARSATFVTAAWASDLVEDVSLHHALEGVCGFALDDVKVRTLAPGRYASPWTGNCIALGAAAVNFDPLHDVSLLSLQQGLLTLLSLYPRSGSFGAERAEYNRLMLQKSDRLADFQMLHLALARYPGIFWEKIGQATLPNSLNHRISLFRARGELAPMEEDGFGLDSWRSFFVGHGILPESYLPVVDRTDPEMMKLKFRQNLHFVKEQVLRQPAHDSYLSSVN